MNPVGSALQIEIQQTRPFSSIEEEVLLAVMRTADDLRGFITRTIQPFGITTQQYNVLRILKGAGERGMPTLSIGDRMIERAPGITRLIDRMESHNWVMRRRCQTDRRIVYACITEAGLALLERMGSPLGDLPSNGFPGMTNEELRTLLELLAKARRAAQR